MTSTQTSKEAAAEEAATEKRLKAAKELLAYVSAPDSTAAQTVAAYADLLDGAPARSVCGGAHAVRPRLIHRGDHAA